MGLASAPPAPKRTRIVPVRMLGDDALARQAAAGSEEAFAALYARYHGPLLGYCRSILLNDEDAGDAAQGALEKALRALPERDAGLPLRPWLYKIAHNESIDIIRRRRPQVELDPATGPTVPGPEIDAEQRGRLTQLVADLRTLPDRQRGALVMRELNGLGYDEIAGALNISPEGARRAVFDARTALHDFAKGREVECTTIRRSLSDGDRRSLRARRIRAHLRSCSDCQTFQLAIRARRADLHLLAPWVSGAAAAGVLGLGAAGSGAVAATTGTGGGMAAGLGWAGLPPAAKSLAVAVAVAATGGAAVEIKHAAEPAGRDRPAERTQARADAAARTTPSPLPARVRPARAAPAPRRATPREGASGVRSTPTRLQARVPASPARVAEVPATAAPVAAPPAEAPAKTVEVVADKPQSARPVVETPRERALDQLASIRERIVTALGAAQTTAAAGTHSALQSARSMLDGTLAALRPSLERVLGVLGVRLPAPPATTPPTTTTTPAGSATPDPAAAFAPVQGFLGGVESLWQKLTGRGAR